MDDVMQIDTTSKRNGLKRTHGQMSVKNMFNDGYMRKNEGSKRSKTGLADLSALSLADRLKLRSCPTRLQFFAQEIQDEILEYLSGNCQVFGIDKVCRRYYEDIVPAHLKNKVQLTINVPKVE